MLRQDTRFGGWFRGLGEAGAFVEFVAHRVSLERPGFEPFHGGGAVPGALVIGVEDIAFSVHAHAAGGTYAGAGGYHFSVRSDADGPAAPVGIRSKGASEAERDPDIAVLIRLGAEGVFVVIALDAPV